MNAKERTGDAEVASTEEKIKEAARRVFTRKGYAATRTRDIAEEAGYNLALLNYYFRSKEKLFDIIMLENLKLFLGSIAAIIDDNSTTFFEKIEALVDRYIDMLIAHPGLPIFVLNEINANPEELLKKIAEVNIVQHTVIARQWAELIAERNVKIHPGHLMMNMMSMIIFPFIGRPIIKNKMNVSDDQFNAMMAERKKLIPKWIKGMLNDAPEVNF